MKTLITGGNGLLGHKLLTLLDTISGVEVVATARRPLVGFPHMTFEYMDITDPLNVKDVVAKHRPDVIIHTAAMTQVDICEQNRDACYQANVKAVEHLIAAARECNAHLVHLSTDFIFDGMHEMLTEENASGPVNHYGECKLLSEELIRSGSISWSIIRTVLVYGIIPGVGRSNILTWVKKNLEDGKRIQVVNDQWRTPTLAEDLAYGCYLAASKRAQGVFHISGKDYLSVYDIAVRTANYFGLDASLISPVESVTLRQSARRPPRTGFNIGKARRELGFEPHSLEQGIAIVAKQMHQ